MAKVATTSMFSMLFVVILGLFFLYLIMNHIMDKSLVVETMTTPLTMGKVTHVYNDNNQ